MTEALKELVIFKGFGAIFIEMFWALVPLLAIFIVFQIFFLKLPRERVIQILSGMLLSLIGLALFLQGVKAGFFPTGMILGETMGTLPHKWIIIPVGFVLGFVATIAEPAVRILSYEVSKVSAGYIREKIMLYTLSLGVAVAVAVAMVRVIYGFPLVYILLPGYIIALLLIKFSSPKFVAIAFDSGGVATGPMAVTFVMTLVIGVATSIPGRDPLLDGFGMIALVALAPILAVLVLGLMYGERGQKEDAGG
ncbi:MAG: DUF1538 domain-containing protein [Desulfotomaculum sp.]|nr:DUF1538 domain-containing protein [Desulfotomaculum sp.]